MQTINADMKSALFRCCHISAWVSCDTMIGVRASLGLRTLPFRFHRASRGRAFSVDLPLARRIRHDGGRCLWRDRWHFLTLIHRQCLFLQCRNWVWCQEKCELWAVLLSVSAFPPLQAGAEASWLGCSTSQARHQNLSEAYC